MENRSDAHNCKRILLVDDERSVRETVRRLLTHDHHTVVEANNGAEALGLFAQDRFDLVVTDCVMPFIEGDELAAKIRELSPQQPILMITGYGRKPGRNNPVDAVLHKPFELSDLRTAIELVTEKGPATPDADTVPFLV